MSLSNRKGGSFFKLEHKLFKYHENLRVKDNFRDCKLFLHIKKATQEGMHVNLFYNVKGQPSQHLYCQ